jgi:hypothetical protein
MIQTPWYKNIHVIKIIVIQMLALTACLSSIIPFFDTLCLVAGLEVVSYILETVKQVKTPLPQPPVSTSK